MFNSKLGLAVLAALSLSSAIASADHNVSGIRQVFGQPDCIGGQQCGVGKQYRLTLPEEGLVQYVRFQAHDNIGDKAVGALRVSVVDYQTGRNVVIGDYIDIKKTGTDLTLQANNIRSREVILEAVRGNGQTPDEVQIQAVEVGMLPRFVTATYAGGCFGGQGCGVGRELSIELANRSSVTEIAVTADDNIGDKQVGKMDTLVELANGQLEVLAINQDVKKTGSTFRYNLGGRQANRLILRHTRPDSFNGIKQEDEIEVTNIEVRYQNF